MRYLHEALEVRALPGRGRGVVATRPVEAGELVMLDTPLMTAESYGVLVEELTSRTRDDEAFRRQVLSMCGDPADVAARSQQDRPPSTALVQNIVRHNYHGAEPMPRDGEVKSAEVFGLWPLGSLLNHSLKPNVARTFAGECSCYRSIKPLQVGDEVLDNYLDLRLPAAMRKDMMRKNHGIDDEGPDACDAPAAFVAEVRDAHQRAMAQLMEDGGTQSASQAAFVELAQLTNRCADSGVKDPAFCDIFRDFAQLAGQLGDANMSLQGFALAVEMATAREPFSTISYLLALRMVHMAVLAKDEVGAETRGGLEALARRHFRIVFGSAPGAFEAANPQLVADLVARPEAATAAAGEDRGAPADCAKRSRTS